MVDKDCGDFDAFALYTETGSKLVWWGGANPVPKTEAEANARRLALCWNMHDELVDIAKCLASLCPSEEGLGGHAPIGAFVQLGSRARAVLAKLSAAP